MTDAGWAYVPSATPPVTTMLDELVAARSVEVFTDLLVEWGSFAQSSEERAAFAATADNVVRAGEHLALAHPLSDSVQPLDRAASHARIAWYLAWAGVQCGAFGAERPERTVDELATDLGNRAGLAISLPDVERARHHETSVHAALRGFDRDALERDMRAVGALT